MWLRASTDDLLNAKRVQMAELFFSTALPLLVGLVGLAWGRRWILRRGSSTWPLRLATSLTLVLVAGQVALFSYEALSWRLEDDLALQQRLCGKCHDPNLPRAFAKSNWGWRRTEIGRAHV